MTDDNEILKDIRFSLRAILFMISVIAGMLLGKL